MWYFTYKSGVHATIAGVLLASTIPHRLKEHDFSLLVKIEHAISPYVAFVIMPIFAFANAGVNLEGLSLSSLLEPVPLGILLGLFFGKQIGVLLFSYISVKLKFADMPNNSNWFSIYGVSILTVICGQFGFCRKHSIYRWCKNWCIKWVATFYNIWVCSFINIFKKIDANK